MTQMESLEEPQQLYLFDLPNKLSELDARLWRGSFSGKESTLQQLSPYVGKMKSGMASALINIFSQPMDIVLDPFSGSGVVPLEAVLAGRAAWANDLSPYAYVLTHGKLEAPSKESIALEKAHGLIESVDKIRHSTKLSKIPAWIAEFFHQETLREIVSAFGILLKQRDYFLTACLLGILHHVRPGFLSYPASHLVPYLRRSKYPPEKFPWMYEYRDLKSRLLAKVKRAYRRPLFSDNWDNRQYKVFQVNSMDLPINDETVDVIISSPPYFGALDYARDNRLRLWFLGCKEWKELDASLTANGKIYLAQMEVCLKEMCRVLKRGRHCILVLGDVERNGKSHHTAEILADFASNVTEGQFIIDTIYNDRIPDERRSRRMTRTTKFERILVMHKR